MTHIERMELELNELNEKIEKGSSFLKNENSKPKFLNSAQIMLLDKQLYHMVQYSETLKDRIEYDSNK
ncbi:MAG: crAss001_48 related protein [Cetobacterium sp.]